MTQVSKLVIIVLSILYFSCTTNKENNVTKELSIARMDSAEKGSIYKKIEYFVSKYDAKEDKESQLKDGEEFIYTKKSYPIDDSLCFYMAKLNRRNLIEDDNFRALMGKLLEKKYLGERNNGVFPPETFPVYNVSLLYNNRTSNSFALNILLKEKQWIDSSFVKYGNQLQGEFYCIDSVILAIDKLPQMQNDSNHQKCMYLVKNNMTGGCKW